MTGFFFFFHFFDSLIGCCFAQVQQIPSVIRYASSSAWAASAPAGETSSHFTHSPTNSPRRWPFWFARPAAATRPSIRIASSCRCLTASHAAGQGRLSSLRTQVSLCRRKSPEVSLQKIEDQQVRLGNYKTCEVERLVSGREPPYQIQGGAFIQMPKSPGCPQSAIHPRNTTILVSTKRTFVCEVIRYRLVQVRQNLNPLTATGYFDIPPPRWPTFLVTLFPILKEGMGLSLLDEFEVQYHVIKK